MWPRACSFINANFFIPIGIILFNSYCNNVCVQKKPYNYIDIERHATLTGKCVRQYSFS